MATNKIEEHGSNKPMKEIAELTEQQKKAAWAKQVKDTLQLIDLENITTKSYTTYNKESLRSYLKNPLSDSNSNNLRKLSQYLYVLSSQYRRLIAYFASQIDLTAYTIVPNISMTEEDNDDEAILKNYEATARWVEKMNLPGQIFSILVTCWREDCFYGYCYYDDSEDQDVNSFIILPLDPQYCRISSVNYDGTLNMAYDFSFFDNRTNAKFLELWDKEFNTKYNTYKGDTKLRWQELDPTRTFVLKFNYDQTDRVIPPFASLFENLIDLADLQGIMSIKDKLSIYKLLVAKIDTLSNAKEPDDFAIDLNTAVSFYNKMLGIVPEEIGLVLSPMDVTPINFEKSDTDDVNKISKANSNLWEAASVSQIFDNDKLTGATAVRAAQILDGLFAHNPLLWQIEANVNRFIDIVIPNNGMRIKYIRVTPYNKDEKIQQIKDAASLGLPVKSQYAALLGMSPLEEYSMSYLENNILKLQDSWMYPLQSSYVQTGENESGGQTKDVKDLTDEGDKTRDGDKNQK